MSVTVTFTANQNPMTHASLTQGNPASSSVNASSTAGQITASTENMLTYSGTQAQTQSVEVTAVPNDNEADFWQANFRLILLYTDANNYVYTDVVNNGTDNKNIDLRKKVAGVDTSLATGYSGLADAYFPAGSTAWSFAVSWSGANATFTLQKAGVNVGTPRVVNSFALTSGKSGYLLTRNSGTRCIRPSQIVFTGESGAAITGTGAMSAQASAAAGTGTVVAPRRVIRPATILAAQSATVAGTGTVT